jgi:predicted RecA/RadA family phage recombinase
MAQTGFMLSDEGRTITVTNDSGTTAITAGDIVYSAANDDVMTGTAASARAAFTGADIKGMSILCSDAGYATPIGVALEDIPADGVGAVALEGIFLNPAAENVEAGNPVQGMEGDGTTAVIANKVQVADSFDHKLGRALTGGTADGKYIVWKLTL